MTDKEKIRKEVERLKRWNDNVRESTRHMTLQEEDFNRGKHSSYLEILNFIDSMQEEPVSEDLGEYINELSKQFLEVSFAKLSRIAVRVAKWKERQLMANAVEGVVHHFEKCKVASVHYNDPTGVPMAYFTSPEGLSAGDKVKIIVIKED